MLLPVSGSNTVGDAGNGTVDGTVDGSVDDSVDGSVFVFL